MHYWDTKPCCNYRCYWANDANEQMDVVWNKINRCVYIYIILGKLQPNLMSQQSSIRSPVYVLFWFSKKNQRVLRFTLPLKINQWKSFSLTKFSVLIFSIRSMCFFGSYWRLSRLLTGHGGKQRCGAAPLSLSFVTQLQFYWIAKVNEKGAEWLSSGRYWMWSGVFHLLLVI